MTVGIYQILNKLTNESYVGQAINIESRWKEHIILLDKNKHIYTGSKNNSILQNAWNKYGKENFEFIILEECLEDELNNKEIYWIAYYNCNRNKTNMGYNLTDGGNGARGYKYTDKDKLKVSQANKGRIHLNNGEEMKFVFPEEVEEFLQNGFIFGELPRSEESKEKYKNGSMGNTNVKGRKTVNNGDIQKMILPEQLEFYKTEGFIEGLLPENIDKINKNRNIVSGENHWHYNKKQSQETIMKRSMSMKGKIGWSKGKNLSDEHKRKISEKSKGRKISKETIEKIKISKSKAVLQYDKENNYINRYISGIEAEKETGILRSHISLCCNEKRKTAGGFIWRFENNE